MKDWVTENRSGFRGEILFDEPLSRHTYYRIGGPAKILLIPNCLEDLGWISNFLQTFPNEIFLVGAGSNVLVSDQGFNGVVIKTKKLNVKIERLPDDLVETGCAVSVSTFLKVVGEQGWAGLEFLTGIPGVMGGVVVMNAGTHLGEAKDALVEVSVFSLAEGKLRTVGASKEMFSYRKNNFLNKEDLVWSATWKFVQGDPAVVAGKIQETLARRKSTQPIDYPSCGSVFKNPKQGEFQHAWQVMDRLGLRGHKVGEAVFSEKHPNFILNLGGAKAGDVLGLITLAKTRAQVELGVSLEEEVHLVGF